MQTKRKRDVDVIGPAQVDRLACEMPENLRASVLLAAWCGLRWGETSELRRADVSTDCGVLHVRRAVTYRNGNFYVGEPKTAAGVRDVAVPPHIRPIIKAHLKNHVGRAADSLLFPDDDGTHLRADRYRTHWEKARAGIGKPTLRVHDLRHVGAVLAAQSGATTAELMHRLGHTTPQMALRYQHVVEGRDAEIAERLSKLAGSQKHTSTWVNTYPRGRGTWWATSVVPSVTGHHRHPPWRPPTRRATTVSLEPRGVGVSAQSKVVGAVSSTQNDCPHVFRGLTRLPGEHLRAAVRVEHRA